MKTRLLMIFVAALMLAGCGNQEKITAAESSTTEDIIELSYDKFYEKVDGDKNGNYTAFLNNEKEAELESGMCGIKDDEVLEDYQLLVYSFGEGEEKVTMSEVYEPVTVDDELDRKVKNGLLEEGYKFYSRKEINERLFKRADEIGLDRSIIVGQPADDDEN